MKRQLNAKIILISGITLGTLMPLSAQAQTYDSVTASIERLRTELIAWLDSAKDFYLELLYQESPDYPNTVAANTSTANLQTTIDDKTAELALTNIKETLTQSEGDKTMWQLAAIPASDTYQASTTGQPASVEGAQSQPNLTEGDQYFSSTSLFNPLVYASDEQSGSNLPTAKKAYTFLRLASGIDTPVGINYSELSSNEQQQLETTEAGIDYKYQMRSFIAARSIPLDNLFNMYNKRLEVEGLGEAAGMADKQNASPAEVEHYTANRRATSEQWYQDMSETSSATIARESLYVQAEMLQLLQGIREDNERILATLSMLALTFSEGKKQSVDGAAQAALSSIGIEE